MEKAQDLPVKLLEQILSKLSREPKTLDDNRLWDVSDIALYMGLSKKTVQNQYVSSDNKFGFPEPVILASGSRRWVAKEVKAFVLKRR